MEPTQKHNKYSHPSRHGRIRHQHNIPLTRLRTLYRQTNMIHTQRPKTSKINLPMISQTHHSFIQKITTPSQTLMSSLLKITHRLHRVFTRNKIQNVHKYYQQKSNEPLPNSLGNTHPNTLYSLNDIKNPRYWAYQIFKVCVICALDLSKGFQKWLNHS